MKKNNNKYRNNSNNNIYNLNYRFDSLSPAGKCSGTALDLIKRYNDLAKEAGSAGNYVEMEVFRQYAEHYRKIVTEINERKAIVQLQQQKSEVQQEQGQPVLQEKSNDIEQQTESEDKKVSDTQDGEVLTTKPLSLKKKTLKIVEVKTSELKESDNLKPKKVTKRKPKGKEAVQPAEAI